MSSDAKTRLDFALETDPSVRRTLLWRLCELGPLRDRALPAATPLRFASKVRHHLGWRLERRYGT